MCRVVCFVWCVFFFFFKQKTAYEMRISDWSSDVCSSDLSNVIGRLSPGKDAIDALFAGFPAGTVSGAPKVRACQIIAELEADARGAYAGGVGYFAPDGNMDSCIVLSTAIVKDGEMHVQAGDRKSTRLNSSH